MILNWFVPAWKRIVVGYGLGTLWVLIAIAVTWTVPPLHATPSVLFFAAVVAATWRSGRGPVIWAIGLSSVIIDFFLIEPKLSLLSSLADVLRLGTFSAVAISILYLRDNYKRAADRLREANDGLELRVNERTAELRNANASLVKEVHVRQQAEDALRSSEVSLRQALADIEVSLKEKEILLRELHHRVNNNLQIITSMLSLQARRIQDSTAQELFHECQHRVRAIALVHQRLCDSANLTHVDSTAYFQQLVQEVFHSYGAGGEIITSHVDTNGAVLGIDQLIPCALIVNELVCNAVKYAFPAGESGEVRVELCHANGQISLTVADNGVGCSPTDGSAPRGVGLQIVEALVEQLSGKLSWGNGRGTSVAVTFPATQKERVQ
jgi:two-component sensor histidine kinase